jgi:hypothetical protein
MKNICKMSCISLIISLLLPMGILGCRPNNNTFNPNSFWVESKGFFQTNDLKRAQSEIPFKILLPTYLPEKRDYKNPSRISGSLDREKTSEFSITIQYGNGEKQITVKQAKTFSIMGANSGMDPAYINISGINVLRQKYTEFWDLNTQFPALVFDWNQGDYAFTVDIFTYGQDEGVKIVESMINQMK